MTAYQKKIITSKYATYRNNFELSTQNIEFLQTYFNFEIINEILK